MVLQNRSCLGLFSSLVVGMIGCGSGTNGVEAGAQVGWTTGALTGGRSASEGEFLATVKIRWGCTAAKVGPRHFLTAAHCVHDTEANSLLGGYEPGSVLHVNRELVDRGWDGEFTALTIIGTHVHSDWMPEYPRAPWGVNVLGPEVPVDLALIEVQDESPSISIAKVDLRSVDVGEPVMIGGYGCEDGLYGAHGLEDPWWLHGLKVHRTKRADASAVEHEHTYFQANDARYAKWQRSYFITPGQQLSDAEASLCPGDSGGPVYRDDGRNLTVVGVNSYYSFKSKADDPRQVSVTNWHTRLDASTRYVVGTWLQGLGVSVVETSAERSVHAAMPPAPR